MSLSIERVGEGVPLVLFHGWGSDSQVWHTILEEITPFFEVFLVDLPGFGQTSQLDWHDFKNSLVAGLPSQFSVAGWSLGGLYATRLAIELPRRVTKLLNIASSPKFTEDMDWPGIPKNQMAQFSENLKADPLSTRAEFIEMQTRRSHPQDTDHSSYAGSMDGLALGLRTLSQWNLLDKLNGICCKTAYLFGGLDPIVPHKTMKALQNKFPQFQYQMFKRSGHMPFMECPELFVSWIKESAL